MRNPTRNAPPTRPPGVGEGELDDPIEAAPCRIEACERRLALSASLAGDALLEICGVQATDPEVGWAEQVGWAERGDGGPELLDEASAVRESHRLSGRGQTVAVIDSGVAWDHVALGGGFGPDYRVVGGWDFAENDADPYDDGPAGYHGTHVAGLLAGQTESFRGVAPGADLVALRVFDDHGRGRLEWVEAALEWVHDHQSRFDAPITTVNLSVGAALSGANRADATAMLEDELRQLRDDGILVFAAAGNFYSPDEDTESGGDALLYPASSPSVVAVSSLGASGGLSDFSQRTADILAARGEGVTSAVPDHVLGWDGRVDDFAPLDGTSMATPQVAGASVLLREAMGAEGLEATTEDVLELLHKSARREIDPISGEPFRIVDLEHAVEQIRLSADPPGSQDEPEIAAIAESIGPEGLSGTDKEDSFVVDLRNGIDIRFGGQAYSAELPGEADSHWTIDARAGADRLEIIGSGQAERVLARPPSGGPAESSRLSTNEFEIELRGFETIVFRGGGGPDRVTLYDGPGDDTLRSHPSQVELAGSGFHFEAREVERAYVHATAGGTDTAFLHDSGDDDVLSVRPKFTSLRGGGTFQSAYGFERVYAYATAGGDDTAELYDSGGDDTMSITAQRSILSSAGYRASARGFDSVIAQAVFGGDDLVRIYADASAGDWDAAEALVQWTGTDGAVRAARGFERALAFERFEPIELTTQSVFRSPLEWFAVGREWSAGSRGETRPRDLEARRAVFRSLGS